MARAPLNYRPIVTRGAATLREKAREIPVWAEADVCVIGGGAAGLGAAVGACRGGAKRVLLVERYGFCGGAAVAGLSGTICGLYASGTAKPEMITQGFAREFHDRLRERGGIAPPWPFGRTFLAVHEPLAWKELADDFLLEHGVGVLYHTLLVDAVTRERTVTHAIVETKDGRGAIAARCFVDASGDADLVARAGGNWFAGRAGIVQSPTMIFRMMKVDVPRAMRVGPEAMEQKVREARASGRYYLPRIHCYLYPSPRVGEYSCNMTRLEPPKECGKLCFSGLEADDLTYCEMEGRKLVREYERFLQENVPGFEQAVVNDVGVQIGIRQTRSIVGAATLRNADVLAARKFGETAVSRSAWPIEDHSGGQDRVIYLENDYYEIPRGSLIPRDLDNVWVAGRCFSAEHEALASARVTAQCFEMGDAAGRMAAESAGCDLIR